MSMKNYGVRLACFFTAIIIFYTAVCLIAKPIAAKTGPARWDGIGFGFILTYIAIPVFSCVLSFFAVRVLLGFMHPVIISLTNSIICAGSLFLCLNVWGMSPQTEKIWYFMYSFFIFIIGVATNGIAFLIFKKIIREV
jgi:hypothetical protein